MTRRRTTVQLVLWPQERWVIERRARNRADTAWLYEGAFNRSELARGHMAGHLLFAQAHGLDATTYLRMMYGSVDQFGRWVDGPTQVWPPAKEAA